MKLEEYEIDGFSITKVTDNLFEEGVSLHLDKKYFKKASDLMKKHKIHQIEINIDSLNDLDFLKHFDFITGLTIISIGKLSSYKSLYNLTKLEKFEDLTESGLENFSIDFNAFVHLRKCKIFWNKNIALNTKIEFLQLFNFNDKNLEKISKLLSIKELHLNDSKLLSLVGMENLLYLKVFKIWNLSKLETLNPIDRLAETLNQVSIVKCKKIIDYSSLYSCKNIESLHIANSGSLKTLTFLRDYLKITTVNICVPVEDEDSSPLKNIKTVYLYKESNLKIPASSGINFIPQSYGFHK